MNRIISYISLLSGIFLMFGIFSCTKENEETLFEAVGDVYYFSKIVENKKVTALAFYAYGNKAIISAMVSLPNDEELSLEGSLENSFTVFNEPNESDFSNDYPEEGIYTFDLLSKDEDNLQSSDELKIENLEIPEITEIRYESNDFSYDVEWNSDDLVDAYLIKMLDSEGEIIFTSNLLDTGESSYILIYGDAGAWETEIVIGSTYTIQLFAFIYDAEADPADFGTATSPMFNLQEMSICDVNFIWDEN